MSNFLRNKELGIKIFLFFILTAAFLYINTPFLLPMILAGVFALGLNNAINTVCKLTKLKSQVVIPLTLLTGLGLLWAPLSLAIYRVVVLAGKPQMIETDQIVQQVHSLKDFTLRNIQKISDWTGMDLANPTRDVLENLLKKSGEWFFNYSSHIVGQFPSTLLSSFVFLLFLYLYLIKAKEIKNQTLKYSPFNGELTDNFIEILKKSCSVTLFSTLVVGLTQASIIGLGSLIFGEGDFWLVLTITFIISFIPVIGAAPMGFLLALLAFLGDRLGATIGLTVVALIAGSIDNFLKPLLMSGTTNVSPIVGFTCVIGAVMMFGLPGLLLGPVIMNLFIGIAPILLDSKEQE